MKGAPPATSIEFHSEIQSQRREEAINAMTDWLGDPRLAAFAIRILQKVGAGDAYRSMAVDVLRSADRSVLTEKVVGDLEVALRALGASRVLARPQPSGDARTGLRGAPGRNYWVMRTSPWERAFVWAEAQRGRLRQGWGTEEDQNLDVIAELLRQGAELDIDQRLSWRSRRMRTTASDGMRLGDLIVAPNLPAWGKLSVFRLIGSYRYEMVGERELGERFGHVLPVELLAEAIDRRAPIVSDGLRAMLRVQARLYSVTGYGADVERLVGNDPSNWNVEPERAGQPWTDDEYRRLFGLHRASGPRPTPEEVAGVAAELGRSFDAIAWPWEDAASYVSGRSASTTSDALKAWLDGNA